MRKLLILMLPILALWGCSDDDKIPADANDNFITELSLTIADGTTYESVISNDVITMTIPYNVSLDGAIVSVVYTPSATIYPNPQEITNWDEERIFRVVAYNGEERKYTYVVEKSDITEEGDIQLKTSADIAAFAAKGVSVINGNLTIGSNEGEDINSLNGLDNLKEISGTLTILNTFKGEDLTGLDKLESVGGLKIGARESYSSVPLEYVSFNSLKTIKGDFTVFNDNVKYIDLKNIESIDGSLNIGSSSLISVTAEKLIKIDRDCSVTSVLNGEPHGEMTQFSLPEITSINGKFSIEKQTNLREISLPKLQTAGSIIFDELPFTLTKIRLNEIQSVNGDLKISSTIVNQIIGSSTSCNTHTDIFEGFSKLKTVSGHITIANFSETSIFSLSNVSTEGISLSRMSKVDVLDFSNTQFSTNGNVIPMIDIEWMNVSKIIGYSNMPCGFNFSKCDFVDNSGYIFENIDEIKCFHIGLPSNCSNFNTLMLPFKKVWGDLIIDFSTLIPSKFTVNLERLENVEKSLIISGQGKQECLTANMPLLKEIGGYFFIGVPIVELNVPILEHICTKDNVSLPEYEITDFGDQLSKRMGINCSFDTGDMVTFPLLKSIGGNGMCLNLCYNSVPIKEFVCPQLKEINNELILTSSPWSDDKLTSLTLPALNSVPKISISNFEALTDFSSFGTLFKNGQISNASDWNISGCGYNPTFEDMKAGKYKPDESAMQTRSRGLSNKASRRRVR